ncbi:MAG: class I SAM-dependent methyltransferase [Burkholderiales bacterium]|nr:class I SAM-dependent methyltransferase [Burkholderiales bacterium]
MNPIDRAPSWLGAALMLIALAAIGGCSAPGRMDAPIDYAALLAAPDRSEADRRADQRRKPAEILAFTGVRPGMKVLDMATGGGYSTELMARAVGPSGVVYGQDAPTTIANARNAFEARAKTPAMRNVVRLMRPFDDPVPAQVRDLDLVSFFNEYHEMPRAKVDRARMNRRLFEILKPGGVLVISDHSARPGDGDRVGSTLHRIEESLVRREVEAAGFRLVAEGGFLRNPGDRRDSAIFKSPVPVDDFFLKFEKPR